VLGFIQSGSCTDWSARRRRDHIVGLRFPWIRRGARIATAVAITGGVLPCLGIGDLLRRRSEQTVEADADQWRAEVEVAVDTNIATRTCKRNRHQGS